MTIQELQFVRHAFDALDNFARFHPYGEELRNQSEKALALLEEEIENSIEAAQDAA